MKVQQSTKTKLSKENLKTYLVTSKTDPKYKRVWVKSSLTHFCKKLYGIQLSEWLNVYKGVYNGWVIQSYKLESMSHETNKQT